MGGQGVGAESEREKVGWTTAPVQVGKVCSKKDCADPAGREGSEMSEVLLKCSGANDLSLKQPPEGQEGGSSGRGHVYAYG